MRRETIKLFKRISRAKNEDELCKIVNDITKHREDTTWMLKEGKEIINDETAVSDMNTLVDR